MVTRKEKQVLQNYWDRENHIAAEMPGYCEIATRALFDKIFEDAKGKKVLDVGCGHGQTLEYFRNRGAIVNGIDLSVESAKAAISKNIPVVVGDCCFLPYQDNSFDIVFSIGVIEHFDATKKAIEEHIRILKPGGRAVIIVPNLISLTYIGAMLWHFLRGNFLRHSIKTTTGKAYTKGYYKCLIWDSNAKNIQVVGYYGSAFLKPMTKSIWTKTAKFIDNSIYSKLFGHLLAGVYEK